MKIRVLLLTLICALAIVPGVQAQAGQSKSEDEPETELDKRMEKMSGAFRRLRRQVEDPTKNADSLERIKIILENTQAALKFEPAKKADLPAAEQAKFVAAYQAEMKDFISLVGKVEAALKANNNEEAKKLVGAMGDQQKKAHKEFQKKKKDKK
ncbi:MAG: hypothetical protein HY736_12250 [Verrucomicrobia bacterium]|nr:hypothetical protein [Verrucomicrobiota bacterium]